MTKKYLLKIIPLLLCASVFSPSLVYGTAEREEAVKAALRRITVMKELRSRVVEQTLKRAEVSLELGYATRGEQTFEVVDNQDRRISRLLFPHRGTLVTLSGEIPLINRFSIGGKYIGNKLKTVNSTDTDWRPGTSSLVWTESNSRTDTWIENYDLNIYYRLFSAARIHPLSDEALNRAFYKMVFAPEEMAVGDYAVFDTFSVDIFAGYFQQKGRYSMTDLVYTVASTLPVNIPIAGQDQFYKTKYFGPRLGVRTESSFGKFSTRFSLAGAWLTTEGYGWWNLSNYYFFHTGKNGFGLDFAWETLYALTPSLSLGIGYNYSAYWQKKLTESGKIGTYEYVDNDIIRNANSTLYGPTLKLRYRW